MYDWPTKFTDLGIFRLYLECYAVLNDIKNPMTIFDLHLNQSKNAFEFQLSPWMQALIQHFFELYGSEQGEVVSRHLMTYCLTQGAKLH